MRLEGIFAPVVTPFRADGGLDLASFEANLDGYAAFELAGFLVLGSNGEAQHLDEHEKLQLVRAARARTGRTLLVGTGLESTQATVLFTRRAAEAGADAALVLTPHYYRAQMSVDALRRHFETVADAAPIPVLLYSVPQFTGLPFPVPLAAALGAHPNVAGMKESSGDLALQARVLACVPERFDFACGSAPVLYPALCSGARAGILAVACCAPGTAVALHAAFARGDHARARELQRALVPLATAVGATWGVAGLKLAMDLSGWRGGAPRAPLLPAPAAARAELEALLARLDADVGSIAN